VKECLVRFATSDLPDETERISALGVRVFFIRRSFDHLAACWTQAIDFLVETSHDLIFVGNLPEAKAQDIGSAGRLLVGRSAVSKRCARLGNDERRRHKAEG
jgi:hypothetical protein